MIQPYETVVKSLITNKSIESNLLDSELFKSHRLYIYLFQFLSPLYPSVSHEVISDLSLSGYLYFRSLLILDEVADTFTNHAVSGAISFEKTTAAHGLQNEAMVLLIKHIPTDNLFWCEFERLKAHYEKTVLLEKHLSVKQSIIDETTFNSIAVGKSIICNAVVAALCGYSGDYSHQITLHDCLENLHIGIQCMDDIEDFEQDIKNRQYTYAQDLLKSYLHNSQLTAINPKEQVKQLYLSGVATTLINKAINHLEYSSTIAESLQLVELNQLVIGKINAYKLYTEEIKFLIQKAEKKAQKSIQFRQSSSIAEALECALNYLSQNISEDGVWSDFLTSAGFGETWITAYVGLQLAESGYHRTFLGKSLERILQQQASLYRNSFNSSVLQDGDTTSFVVGFLHTMQRNEVCEYVQEWLHFMNDDGGWVTYRDEQSLRKRLLLEETSPQGWLSDKACVSAASAYVLSLQPNLSRQYEQTCQYLLKKINSNSCINSYWWTSPIYATSFAIMAFSKSITYRKYAEQLVNWLLDRQCPYGYWKNEFVEMTSPLYTALALKALILFDFKTYDKQIRRGVDWLLHVQTKDGSWLTNRILKIPATSVNDPEEITSWRLSSFGVNCIVDDHNRVFTTASVLNTLELFDKLAKNIASGKQ